ncbi:MAG: YceI family protein [Hyphomonas sp.]|uniref:YceI family protein n=1 Tax=Hyphomonas sp. TaxID=87 RepID=UPI001816F766|nr:YceI family protein [Hyphomonas sp.]MBA3068318.1 YceI family protein [Hyphomonas sp.]MBU4060816.1 YceI family protein [Alphaproteobacteria bacterium]MBU4164800.1 YceI family protein [Alphaproteobacteria bacterium]MBU4569075.1 YceI family protein [Alphaproteobacteria bacterium]
MAGFEKDLIRKTSGLNAALLALAFSLAGCSSLASAVLKPQVESAPVSVPAGDYALDTKHASILFKISHLGYSSYVGRFNTFDASLTGDPAHPEAATVTAVVDMTSLDIANPEFAGELMGPDWFDAATFPQATFKTYGLKIVGENEADISGDLTLKGKTQAVIIRARLNGSAYDRLRGADVVGFSATLPINRADFGIDKYSGLITDDVVIEIEAEFIRTKPAG